MYMAELKDNSERHIRRRIANCVVTLVLERTEGPMGRINCCIIIEIVTSSPEKEIKDNTDYQGKSAWGLSTDNTHAVCQGLKPVANHQQKPVGCRDDPTFAHQQSDTQNTIPVCEVLGVASSLSPPCVTAQSQLWKLLVKLNPR